MYKKVENISAPNKAIYASRGIHSILKVSFYLKSYFQADKSTAGLKPRPGTYNQTLAVISLATTTKLK